MVTFIPTVDQTDDASFLGIVEQIIKGAIFTHQPVEVCIFKINQWFDHKWLGFSGKTLGALGVWKGQLTIPPFVANRIADHLHFEQHVESGAYQQNEPRPGIHHRGRSGENLQRFVDRIAANSALFWYSGNTAVTGRGSLMGYIPVEDDYWPWFLAFSRDKIWRIARRKSIHDYEVRLFQGAGEETIRSKAANM